MVQSCPEASPAKWHLAHTTWFFESFVLREFLPGYRVFDADFAWLFNSYYESFSAFPEKRLRSSFSRPGLDEILRYREHVDAAMERLSGAGAGGGGAAADRAGREPRGAAPGIAAYRHSECVLHQSAAAEVQGARDRDQGTGNEEQRNGGEGAKTRPLGFRGFEGGLREAGHAGDGFCFDNELPRHRVWLEPYALADRLVTCGEFAEFMADGGYRRPEFWLSAGWDAVKDNGWRAPLYWTRETTASGACLPCAGSCR